MNTHAENLIRQKNLDAIRGAAKALKAATKPQLAAATGLSTVTVNSLVAELVANSELLEGDTIQPQLGRPARVYTFNAEQHLSLLITLYEENQIDMTEVHVCDMFGNGIYSDKHPMPFKMENTFDDDIGMLVRRYPAIDVVGFGIPGVELNGMIATTSYPELHSIDLAQHLQRVYQVGVFFENDVNAATLGFCYSHPEYEEKDIVGLYFPMGGYPGAAIYTNHNIYKGANGLAGEIMHMPFCGNWAEFDYSEANITQYLQKTIQAISCLLNPDMVVIYTDTCVNELPPWDVLTFSYGGKGFDPPHMILPKIVFADSFQQDYLYGLSCSAIKRRTTLISQLTG